jgi:hypothetical protein
MAFPLLFHVTRGRPSKKWDSGVSKVCRRPEDVELFDGNITVFMSLSTVIVAINARFLTIVK